MNSLESAANLLVLALADQGVSCDHRRLAADLRQASTQAGHPDASEWADWFLTASPASGLKCRKLTGQPEELEELAMAGGIVLIQLDGEWLAIGERGSVRSIDTEGKMRSDRSLRQCLSGSSVALKSVVIEGGFPQSVADHHGPSPWRRLIHLLAPEWRDILTILIYSLVIALLTLATPIAVESLVNTVAFGRLVQPIVVLSVILFGFLSFSAALRALQTFVAEIVQRRLFARVASDLAWRLPRVDTTAIEGRNMPELVNRFFDVVTVQKVVSQFLLDGIGIVLTTLIGMTVLAFYHPLLLAFDIVLLIAVAIILLVFGYGAVGTSIKESKYKYATADTLEEIARCVHLWFNALFGVWG
jgi:putative ABC transport system ATP-binding protein